MSKYIELTQTDFNEYLQDITLLIVTATELETKNTHEKLTSIDDSNSIYKVSFREITLYLGKLGHYLIAHVQCTMGASSRSSSTLTIRNVLDICSSIKAVIMVGIAFGVENKKQEIGHVLVSKSIIPYDSKRIGVDKVIPRGIETPASQVLLDRLRALEIENNYDFKITQTRLLSGETLVDNLEFRNSLKELYPDSLGGEMEGTGVAAACGAKYDWVLIKSICDYGDGKKNKNKNNNQKIAIENSLKVLLDLLNYREGLRDIGITPYIKKKVDIKTVEKILFEIYNDDSEPYYIQRDFDSRLEKVLVHYGIWVYGESGMGKTNSILRNLKMSRKRFCQVWLSSCCNGSIDDYFCEIAYELGQFLNVGYLKYPTSFRESIILIKEACKNISYEDIIYIYIDEIPLGHKESEIKEFSKKFYYLLTALIGEHCLKYIRFILSSISNPKLMHIDNSLHQKFSQYIQFVDIGTWNDDDLKRLNAVIINGLGVKISVDHCTKLLNSSNSSPRFIKRVYKQLLTSNNLDNSNIENTIQKIKSEYGIS